jgi:hypothetical protein
MDLNQCQKEFISTQAECSAYLKKLDKFVNKNYLDVSCEHCGERDIRKALNLKNRLEALVAEFVG